MPADSENPQSTQLHVPSVVEVVVQRLRRLILSGDVRPGDRLIEERLTEMFGVSRPPLREALRILQQDGLVSSLPRRGFIVVPMTVNDIREIYSLRFALERMAVEIAVPVDDQSRLDPMRGALAHIQAALLAADNDALLEANSQFHICLVRLSRHQLLISMYEGLRLKLEFCMAHNLKFRERAFGTREDDYPRHARLLESIEKGDRKAALRGIAHHGNRSFLSNLDELMDPPDGG